MSISYLKLVGIQLLLCFTLVLVALQLHEATPLHIAYSDLSSFQ